MAEAFGVVTGALTVIQISKQVVSACYQYYRSAKAAKQEILNVINVVGGLQTTLDNLRLLDNPSDLPNVNGLEASIKACHSTLQKLATELGVDVTQSVDPDIRVKLNLPQRLFWPWKEKEVEKLLEVIERHKATFILALGADTLRATRAIRNGVSEITESVRTIAIDQRTEQKKDEKHKILTWLKASDPSLNHLAARKKHEPTTGNWFLQSKTFSRWTQGSVKSVWLYGIPGAGKTVLCSTVIEQVNELCSVKSRHQLAYHYFDFSDRDKQTFVGILRSMITQLCVGMDEAPDELIKLYHQCGDGTKQPRKESLIETFISAMAWTNRTYVIMDALDECAEQEELLTFLSQLLDKDFTPFDVRVLVTSRKEHCITEELGHSIDTRINLEGQGIDHDIEVYVLKRVERDKSLRKWPDAIQLEIRDALVNGAHGMFRWVECQLNTLRKCLTVTATRKALRQLPETLNETYGRIISNIPEQYYPEARRVMQILAVAHWPLTIEEIAEAIGVDCENESFDPENRLRDPLDILEICSSLISLSGEYLRFAHYSVREYLASSRIFTSSFSTFGIEERVAHQMLAKMCLIYLLSFDQPVQSSRYSLHFPFRLYALRQWHTHLHAAKVGESRTPEKDLVIRFFDPASVPYQNFLVDYNSRPILPVFGKRQPILPTLSHALWLSSLLGLFDVVESLLLSGVEITLNNRQDWTCYPLLAAAYRGHVGVVRLLLKHGANVNCYTAGYRYPLLVAALGEHVSTVQLLLNEGAQLNGVAPIQGRTIFAACQLGNIDGAQILLSHGANVNQEGGRWGKTPLQCAASSGSIELVRLMLRRGADVNFEGGYYCTALIAATNHGHEPIVQLLLENRANVDAQAHSLGTALHQAVVHGYKGIASLLKAKGGQDFDGTVE